MVFTFIAGGAPSFTIGGLIATRSNITPVLYLAGAIVLVMLLYIALVLPESFPAEKREALRLQRRTRQTGGVLQSSTFFQKLLVPFEPLKQLKPRRHHRTGKRNWRLVYCAMHIGIANIGDDYATIAVIVFLTTQHGYTPADVRVH